MEDWIDKLNKWIKTFVNGVELTKGRMMAVYRFTEDEEETSNMFQSVRAKRYLWFQYLFSKER